MSPRRPFKPGSAKHALLHGASPSEPRALTDLRAGRKLKGPLGNLIVQLVNQGLLSRAGHEAVTPGSAHHRQLYLLTMKGVAALEDAGPLSPQEITAESVTSRLPGPDAGPVERASFDAAQEVLDRCVRDGHPVGSPFEAVLRGYITALDWCALLDRHRARYGLDQGPDQRS